MSKVLSFLKAYKKEAVLAPLFKMTEALLELFVPIVISKIIDIGIVNSDKPFIIKACLVLFLLAAVGLGFSVTAQYFSARAAVGMATSLKSSLFSHIQSLSYSELDKTGTSTLITRMTSDVNQVQSGVNLTLRLFLRSPFIVFGAMIMAFTLDVPSALIFAITIPVLLVIVFLIIGITIPRYKNVQQKLDKLMLTTRENLSGVRVIRAFCKEPEEVREFSERNESLNLLQRGVGKISALMNPLTLVIINVAVVVLLWTGAVRVNNGVISSGTVVALYNYMAQILVELIKLANLIVNITKSIAGAKRISAVFDIEPSDIEKSDCKKLSLDASGALSVSFSGVSFKYSENAGEALSGITFDAPSASTVGIIGGTGSGKSTLVNLIPRFYDATDGVVSIGGINVKNINTEELRSSIGIVPQKAVLFKGTIRENMLFGNENATDEDIINALKTAQAYDFVAAKDGVLDCKIEQYGRNLSGGQRQRLTVARALVKKPGILILDDSASALDLATDAALRKAIAAIEPKPTLFIVSQRASAVMNSDIILVLDDGKLVDSGKHSELLESSEIYSEIYRSQYKKDGE